MLIESFFINFEKTNLMNLFDYFQHLILTDDQRNALEKLYDFLQGDEQVFILQGLCRKRLNHAAKGFVAYLQSMIGDTS